MEKEGDLGTGCPEEIGQALCVLQPEVDLYEQQQRRTGHSVEDREPKDRGEREKVGRRRGKCNRKNARKGSRKGQSEEDRPRHGSPK
jgi:hypothetical protein